MGSPQRPVGPRRRTSLGRAEPGRICRDCPEHSPMQRGRTAWAPPPPHRLCFLLVKFTLKPVGTGVGNAACRDQLPSRNQSRARVGAGRQGEIDTTED